MKFHKRFDQRQAETMRTSFSGLFSGMGLAVILVYLLMVIKFQSWLDPVIVLMAVPFALAGVMWMLFVTQTHICVPALMGTLMCIGLITANSILVVTFANDRVDAGDTTAAITAGFTRLRPVLTTAGDGDVFLTYVTEVLAPKLKRGQIVMMDNLPAHKVASIRQAIGRFAGSIQGDLRAEELAVFREQVEMLRRSLSGAAEFSTMEEWFGIKLVANGNGQIECIGFVMDQLGIGNRLTFRFSIDQSFLPPMLVSLDTICSKFPAIGKP